MDDRGACPQRRVLRQAHDRRDAVGRREADAPDVAAEPVGVRLDDSDGIRAIAAVDLRRLRHGDAVCLREDHQLACSALSGPRLADRLDAPLADAAHLAQAAGVVVEDVYRVRAERVHDPARVRWADAPDEAGGEVAADALDGLRRHARDRPGLELPSARGIVHPLAFSMKHLPFPHGRARAEDHRLLLPEAKRAVAIHGHAQHGEASLVVAEHDGLDGPVHRPAT